MSDTATDFDYEQLDPGIRMTVKRLRDAGYETTDSGDGGSKPAEWFETGEAMPFPHVVVATTCERMCADADAIAALLGSPWVCEASYFTAGKVAVVMARHAFDGEDC